MAVDYRQRKYGGINLRAPGEEYNGPCNCCGASYSSTEDEWIKWLGFNKGIKIVGEKVGEEMDNGFTAINHVQTKQGVLTVSINYA